MTPGKAANADAGRAERAAPRAGPAGSMQGSQSVNYSCDSFPVRSLTGGLDIHTVEVQVHLKEGVADPVGANTKKTLELLGIEGIDRVRSVGCYVFQVEAPDAAGAEAKVEEACRRLLANPVIHRYTVKVVDGSAKAGPGSEWSS